MVTVALLGLGAMGSRVAARLVGAGLPTAVWNRSPGPGVPGARTAKDPVDAVRDAAVVLVCVRGNEASAAVWAALRRLLSADAVAIELSTVTPGHAAALADLLGERLLAAPMVGSRPQVDAGQLQLVVGGAAGTLARARAVLEAVAPDGLHHMGDARAAATLKLVVNGMLVAQLAAAGELLAVARSGGVDPAAAAELLAGLPVASPALARSLPRAVSGDLAPAFPLDLVAKDVGYLLDAAGGDVPVLRATGDRVAALIAAGGDGDDVVALAAPHAVPTPITP